VVTPENQRGALKQATGLEVALKAAASACRAYRMGDIQAGDEALAAAAEMITVAFHDGSDEAVGLATVFDAIEALGDRAEIRTAFDAIVVHLGGLGGAL
jgi:hypothetical protein